MKKFIHLTYIAIGIASLAIIIGTTLTSPANAQTASPDAAQGLQVSPALVELNVEPGKTYTIDIKATNVTLTKLAYVSTVNDFNSKDETGAANVLLNSNLPDSASVVSWITTLPEFTLDTHESRSISAQVKVPSNAEPGGHYGVIRFSGHAPELTGTGVGLSASTGILLLIRVTGDIKESASLESFYTSNNNHQTSFFEKAPIAFVTRIKNDGNIHVKPIGSIEITDIFGNSVGTIAVNDSKSNVLPNSIRHFDNSYDSNWMFGRYTANLTLGYGTTGQAITGTITFWVIPYKLILGILLIIATLVYILSRLVKVYNRRIIAKSKHETNKNNKKNT